jgi:hypothetical protein
MYDSYFAFPLKIKMVLRWTFSLALRFETRLYQYLPASFSVFLPLSMFREDYELTNYIHIYSSSVAELLANLIYLCLTQFKGFGLILHRA